MKASVITEDQLKEIEDALKCGRSVMLGETPDGALMSVCNALAIMRLLKPQEPAAWQDTAKLSELIEHDQCDPMWHAIMRPLYAEVQK